MGRKAYIADLNAATKLVIDGIANLSADGKDDGEFGFTFKDAEISVLVPDLSEYPATHSYMLYVSNSDDADPAIAAAVETFSNTELYPGCTIARLLEPLSRFLQSRQPQTGDVAHPFLIDDDDLDDFLEDEDENDDILVGDFDDMAGASFPSFDGARDHTSGTNSDANPKQARADLRAVREAGAGFKVGVISRGGEPGQAFLGAHYVSVAISINKLELSEDVIKAWGINSKNDYLVLLFYYPAGYYSLETLSASPSTMKNVKLGVFTSHTYRPVSMEDASNAMKHSSSSTLRPVFIANSLAELLNGRLIALINLRLKYGFKWCQAEHMYHASLGQSGSGQDYEESYRVTENEKKFKKFGEDQLGLGQEVSSLSFPLIAFQYTLRQYVSCTEFCLVCHNQQKTDKIEYLKPFVCTSPLCLYQYMALGFGPSIEHELLIQPLVADLLISFAYAAIKRHNLPADMMPSGLALRVPDPESCDGIVMSLAPQPSPSRFSRFDPTIPTTGSLNEGVSITRKCQSYVAKLNQPKQKLLFEQKLSPVRVGDWIGIKIDAKPAVHCKVLETRHYPMVLISEPIVAGSLKEEPVKSGSASAPETSDDLKQCAVYLYDCNFDDDLTTAEKYNTMSLLLDLMPSVTEMGDYIKANPGKSLATWSRMPPASLLILRWIIASTRASIMQVDVPVIETDGRDVGQEEQKPTTREPRVQGMHGWIQFRFASGAPDKEQRFIDAVKKETDKLDHPTIFAWHGSELGNWHSIVRQGLHFNKTTNGRAYGHGVYHAKDFVTSNGYSRAGGAAWPQSILEVTTAVALSEVINAPTKFISQNPYYVIQHIDWIQTRYLFVSPKSKLKLCEDALLPAVLSQDPTRTPTGLTGIPIKLPLNAISRSRWPRDVRKANRSRTSISADDDDTMSVTTQDEDTMALLEPSVSVTPQKRSRPVDDSVLPFVPGQLESLPLTNGPSYASAGTTRRLQKDFQALLATQEAHMKEENLSALGWYVDPAQFAESGNLYQWIVELHSFDLSLPLAEDMIKAKLSSVVLEFRFHNTYPMGPPFVRVIRPRFLPFAMGGGGHVTAGGSICMDLLTNSGWSAVASIESVLLQIRMAICSTDPRPARLENVPAMSKASAFRSHDYGVGEAVEAFRRAANAHGWQVPPELAEVAAVGLR